MTKQLKNQFILFLRFPVVLLNNSVGIATGFRCNIPGYYIGDIVDAMINVLKKKKIEDLTPWYKDFKGYQSYGKNDKGQDVFTTGFGFEKREPAVFFNHMLLRDSIEKKP